MKPTRTIVIVSSAAAVVAFAGCASSPGGDELTTVNIAHSVSSALSAVPFAVATANGYFTEGGCELGEQLEEALGGANTLRSVIDGGLDMGEVATNAAIEAALAGTPITVVGKNDHDRPHDILYAVRSGEDISSVDDLVGKRFGYTNPGSATEDIAYLIKHAAGIDPGDIELVPTNGLGGGLALLEGGDVDAAMIIPVLYEQNKDKYDIGFGAMDYVDEYQATVYVASDKFLEENPEGVRCILAGLDKAMKFIVEDTEAAAQIYSEHNEDYTFEQLKDELALAVEVDSLDGSVGFNVTALENVALARELRTGETASIPWEEIFQVSFLPSGAATELPKQ